MKQSSLIFTVAIIAFIGGLSVRGLSSSPLEKVKHENHRALPEFNLPDLSGKLHSSKEWKNKVLVLNFWATWCPPCLKEMPEFQALQNEYSAKGLQVIGIALDDFEPVKAFIDGHHISYPILLGQDQGAKIAHDLGNIVDTVPFTVIINKQGSIIKSQMGTLTKQDLLSIVSPLFNQK